MLGSGTGTLEVPVREARRLQEAGHRVVDVREDDEFAAGHVPGALHIPLWQLPARLGELEPGASWLVICRTGGRSLEATFYMARAGLSARNVDGGMFAWWRADLPIVDPQGRPGRVA